MTSRIASLSPVFRRLLSCPQALFGIVCLALLCGQVRGAETADAGEKVLLRYQFHVGQIVRYDVTMNDDYKIQVGQNVDEPYSHQTSTKNYRVRAVQPDGSAILELTIESVKLEIHQNGETFRYDSHDAESAKHQPVFQAMENLVGKPHLQLQISPQGEVSAFVPLVEGDQVPDQPGQAAFDVLVHLPTEPMAVGDTWREDVEISLPVPESQLRKSVKMQRRFVLKSVDRSLATIEYHTVVLSVLEDADEEMQLLRRKPRGTVVIDLEKGLLVSQEVTQDNQVTGFGVGASLMNFKQAITETLSEVKTAETPAASQSIQK